MKKTVILAILLLVVGQACMPTPTTAPTSTPLPTFSLEDIQAALTGTAAAQPTATQPPSPTLEASPTIAIEPSQTASPIPSGTVGPTAIVATVPPTPARLPAEVILIVEPGVTSRVASPIHISGEADPTFEQNLVIEVLGENGAQLAQMPVTIGADVGQRGPFTLDIPFSVTTEQPGRIAVRSESARDGGITHYASVEVTLLPSGPAQIETALPHPEHHAILQPAPNATVSGGVARVHGFSEPTFEQNLVIEIFDAEGNSLALMPTTIQAPDVGQPGYFTADVPYSVTAEQPGRIVVYSESARDGGLLHLSSVEVTLAP